LEAKVGQPRALSWFTHLREAPALNNPSFEGLKLVLLGWRQPGGWCCSAQEWVVWPWPVYSSAESPHWWGVWWKYTGAPFLMRAADLSQGLPPYQRGTERREPQRWTTGKKKPPAKSRGRRAQMAFAFSCRFCKACKPRYQPGPDR